MNEAFEKKLHEELEGWLKSHFNDPFRHGPRDFQAMISLLILQKLTDIGQDLTAIREALALRETEAWSHDLP